MATDTEILEAAARNAFYIVQLEIRIAELDAGNRQLRKALQAIADLPQYQSYAALAGNIARAALLPRRGE